MHKRLMIGLCAALWFGQASASNSIEYNIARGLAPEAKGQSISVLKPFYGDFRILGSKQYQHDEQAKFSPIDYAVSWGLFAHPDIASQIKINQYDRYLNWSMRTVPVPPAQALKLVSNMHIIPASPEIAKQITQVKRGDLVRLKGDLVEIKDNNLVWTSSLSPGGVGDGACEVFRVNSIQWIEREKI
ncbi:MULTISPECIES: hypothetical protein [Acinetobacter]|nr:MULTISPECIES: hypothetical protein [Acinetobacter]ENV55063.1 hypothetical protein F952_00785 [Acinetobacter baylyi DSM 14961 = CIP 107474]KAF2371207.1 hypothetical protein BSL88_08205 [Acinetobacter baylyi]KAF2374584.1 hypothetical protein BSL67_04580 [Acinetobacter baylyi]KAF2377044.1 hypothetical protein BSN81_10390 [Acinetobacter baylyi]KAF2381717.1 hypothetical protein BSN83_04420 [Acinetobacter baylyi]